MKQKPQKHAAQKGFRNIKKRIKVWELKVEHRELLKSDEDLSRIMRELHELFISNPPLDFEHKWTRLHLYYPEEVQAKYDALKKEYQEILTQQYADFIEKV